MARRRNVEDAVAQWLATHHAVIARRDAKRLGLTDAQIRWRLDAGIWTPVHRGVYLLAGTPLGPLQVHMAAVTAAGRRARLSHCSAAWAWGWLGAPPVVPEVIVPATRCCAVAGVRVRRSRRLERPALRRGIPCTTPARTLVDCAGELPRAALDDLVDDALASPHLKVESLTAALALGRAGRLPPLKGITAVRSSLEARGYVAAPDPSALESRMARLISRSGHAHTLHAEVVWGPARAYRLDFADPALQVAIEVDGYAWHRTSEWHRRTLRRDRQLNQAGWTVLHYTWWEVVHDADVVVRDLTAALTRQPTAAVICAEDNMDSPARS